MIEIAKIAIYLKSSFYLFKLYSFKLHRYFTEDLSSKAVLQFVFHAFLLGFSRVAKERP